MDLTARKTIAESLTGGALEVRRVPFNDFELREVDGIIRFSGVASVTDTPYDMGYYQESISRGAFGKTLSEKPDVQLLINHDGLPIARTGRNMTLAEDDDGLRVAADLNPELPRVREVQLTANDGLIDQMSFAFRVTRQTWDEDYENREITEVNIHRGDVSIVNQGANPATSFSLRDAHQFVSAMSQDEFVEFMRSIRPDEPEVVVEEDEVEPVRAYDLELYKARAVALRLAAA